MTATFLITPTPRPTIITTWSARVLNGSRERQTAAPRWSSTPLPDAASEQGQMTPGGAHDARPVSSAHSYSPTARIVAEAREVSRVYGSGSATVWAVDGVDIAVRQGELVAIVGPSGSGKSTLMHLLAGLDVPTAGTVLLDGQSLEGLSEAALADLRRTRVGFVFQAFNLLPGLSVLENIRLPETLGETTTTNDRAWEAELIRRLGLQELLQRRPHELSGGQQQRVAIVRALAHRPAIVFADEPTGNLDVGSGGEVLRILQSLAHEAGCGIVIVTHDATTASIADRVLYVRDGKIVRQIGKTTAAEIARFLIEGDGVGSVVRGAATTEAGQAS